MPAATSPTFSAIQAANFRAIVQRPAGED